MEFVRPNTQPAEAVMDYSLLGGEHVARGRRLFRTASVCLVVLLLYLTYKAEVDNQLHLFQGLLIVILSFLPSLLWARTGGSRFPAFEVITFMCANAYGLPLLNAREQLAAYHEEVISLAGWTVILYLFVANLTYRLVRGRPGRSRFWREPLITRDVEKLIVYGLVLSSGYVAISTFTTWVPSELESIFRAVFYGLGILCTFVTCQRWGRGELTRREKNILLCTLIPQLLFMAVSLILVMSISLIGIALLGYLSGGKRIPWVPMILAFAIIAILHTGKTRMRMKYWDSGVPPPTLTELPGYFAEWIDYGLQPTSGDKTAGEKMLERTSLIHMLCLVIEWTPSKQDYLYGETYGHVLPQLIPRFFWPEKPRSHIATYQLSIRYGLQDEEATNTTTIAFGLLTEAYANFGLFGAVLLGAFWGVFLKKCQIWSSCSPMFSFAGLFMILLTAWAFSSELTMAAWVSSFQQAVVVVLGLPLLLRSLLGY